MSSVLFGLPSLVANDQVKSSSDDEQLTKKASMRSVTVNEAGLGQGASSTRPMSAQVCTGQTSIQYQSSRHGLMLDPLDSSIMPSMASGE